MLTRGSGLLTGANYSGIALASDIKDVICDTLGDGLVFL
jgi:hypothetical protein